ncbi:peptidylprolyl isomerase [Butyricicoccus sp.]|uniref:peptidylprolyl isomerase n=1 Tax=Butyricicoccus sp. TaxID=2049021 RepID=UPI003AB0662E
MKRLLSMLMAGILCVGMLATMTGCGTKDNTPVVATIDGEDVHSSELAAYIVYNMMYYENSFGMDIKSMASDEIFGSIKEGCLNQAKQYRAIKKLAENEGVSLSKDSKKELKENLDSNRQQLGSQTGTFTRWLKYKVKGDEDPFVTYLNSYGYTEELYESNNETMQLMYDIIDKYYDQGDITKQFQNTYLHAKSILIKDVDDSGNELTGDALTAAQNKAQSILDQVKADPSKFDDLWKENNADTAQSKNGYYFTEGDMVDEYYQAVAKMEEGAINDQLVYYKGYGWFIIEKLKLEDSALTDTSAYLNNSGDGDESTIKSAIGQQMVQDKLDGIIEDMKVETTDEYDKITAYNVNTYLPFNADAFVSNGSGSAGSAVGSAG